MKHFIIKGRGTTIISLLIFCIFMLNNSTMFAQVPDGWCATPENFNPDTEGLYSYSIDPDLLATFEPVVFNIYFWGINKSDGSPGFEILTEEQCLTSVSLLNRVYNEFNIFFKYYGYDNTSFNSDDFYHLSKAEVSLVSDPNDLSNVFNFAAYNGYKKTNSFNVYVASGGAEFGGAAEDAPSTSLATHNAFANGTESMIAHEIGHCLNLHHTFINWTDSYCEHVTRDATSSHYNANSAGDKVYDTAAMPNFSTEHLMELLWDGVPFDVAIDQYRPYKYIDSITFAYNNPNGDDCEETDYDINIIDVKNYMSYSPTPPEAFFEVFTIGQKIKMREAIANDENSLFSNTETTIASLYEPYKGSYPAYYPYPEPWQLPLFQPGFKYVFVECSGEYPQPAPYGEIFDYDISNTILSVENDETNYNSIAHPNHSAITIKHANYYGDDVFPLPQKCYNNYNSPPIIGGTVVKFNDNVFNTNVTIFPQDSTSINSPTLINNLDSGLYNIIKNYPNGGTIETVIIK